MTLNNKDQKVSERVSAASGSKGYLDMEAGEIFKQNSRRKQELSGDRSAPAVPAHFSLS